MGLELDDLQGPLQPKPFSGPVVKSQNEAAAETAELRLSVACCDQTRGDGFKPKEGTFRPDIKKK